jgi:hypothetical protein
MPDVKFSCPHCQQHIEADAGYAGMRINCPTCNGGLTVPGVAVPVAVLAPAPIPSLPRQTSTPAAPAWPSSPAGQPGALVKTAGRQSDATWGTNPYVYVGALIVVLGILYGLGRSHPAIMQAFLFITIAYIVVVQIIVDIAGFQESVGTGFLTLCVPFYAIYLVYFVVGNRTLKVAYGASLLLSVALRLPGVHPY